MDDAAGDPVGDPVDGIAVDPADGITGDTAADPPGNATRDPLDDVLDAIADPVRREILAMLRGTTLTVGDIARRFPISRPAVSRHLRVLRHSGLVHDELVGRRRFYTLDPSPLAALAGWIARLSAPDGWAHRLDALETEVRRTTRDHRTQPTAPAVEPTEDIG